MSDRRDLRAEKVPEWRDGLSGWGHFFAFLVAACAMGATVPIGRMVNHFFEGYEDYAVLGAVFVLTYLLTVFMLKHGNRGDRIAELEGKLKRAADEKISAEHEEGGAWARTEQELRALEILRDSYGEDGRPVFGKPMGFIVSRRVDIEDAGLRINPLYREAWAFQKRFRVYKTDIGASLEVEGTEGPIKNLQEFPLNVRRVIFVANPGALVVAAQRLMKPIVA